MKKKGILALVLALVLCVGLLAACGGNSGNNGGEAAPAQSGGAAPAAPAASGDTIKIGYVNPTTGALAGNGEGCDWVVNQITNWVKENGGITVDGAQKEIQVIVYDSESDSAKCSEMAQKLIEEDNVDLMVAIQTPETVIPVAATAERYGVPCIAIQAPVNPVAANVAGGSEAEWVYEAFWTIETVYECHKALWTAAGYGPGSGAKIGLAFANDADGSAWHDIFVQKLPEDGYEVVDPGMYPSGSDDFTSYAAAYKAAGINILAGTNIPPDFLKLYKACINAGVQVDCVTMGKCCLLSGDVAVLEGDTAGLAQGIMTEVWWTPDFPYSSGITGISSADLGAAYTADTGRTMPQPAGYAYAALELAIDVFTRAGTTDKEAVRDALAATDLATIVGPIKYDKELMGLKYGEVVICGGQWQLQEDGTEKLVIIDNTVYANENIPIQGSYVAGNATKK
ncbi:MAG: ABC transporter substrate-binding protein [Parasporobacterium sp.]|nr:ABC transporter substrate-binding protein [Parasporobacterium sp.]